VQLFPLRLVAALIGSHFVAVFAPNRPRARVGTTSPVLVQTSDAAQAARVHAAAALCEGADNPGWGLFAQHLVIASTREKVKAYTRIGVQSIGLV
jgi:hypothetical protein